MAIKVSVVIPVHNVEAYLRQCLDSVVNQTLRDIEIICVDDGSTDGSPAILAEYAVKDPRVNVLTRSKTNAGAARNAGLDVAAGEYCFFADADDFLGGTALERLVAVADREADDLVVMGHKVLEQGTFLEHPVSARAHESVLKKNAEGVGAPSLYLDVGVMPWNKLFRRSFLVGEKLRYQERIRHNDVEFVCQAVALAARVGVFGGCGYVYRRGRAGSLTASNSRHDAFVEVLKGLRQELESRNLWERYSVAFQNLALAHCFYHLLGGTDAGVFEELYAALHGHVLSDLGLDELTADVVANSKHWRYLQATLAGERPTELFMLILAERYDNWKTIERLKAKVTNAK